MFISIGRKLRGLGHVRFGFRLKGPTAWIMVIFYGLFYMCWYMILGTLWLMYGIGFLFFYLPIKGIVKLCKRRRNQEAHSPCTDSPKPTPSPTHSMPPSSPPTEDDTSSPSPNKTENIVRWVGFGIFVIMFFDALFSLSLMGFLSALLFLLGAFVIVPFDVIESIRSKLKINKIISFVLAAILLVVGVMVTSSSGDPDPDKNDTILAGQVTKEPSSTHKTPSSSTPKENKVTSPNTTPSKSPQQTPTTETVYYTSTGTKYHSRKTCPGLNSAKTIYETDLETAKGKGLSPCSRCH